MLKGISPVVSPDLLKTLAEMGHGDEIVFSDAHFPAHTFGIRVMRADGVSCAALLKGVAPLFELDAYAVPVAMMAPVPGDELDPEDSRCHCCGTRLCLRRRNPKFRRFGNPKASCRLSSNVRVPIKTRFLWQ